MHVDLGLANFEGNLRLETSVIFPTSSANLGFSYFAFQSWTKQVALGLIPPTL